MNNDSQKPASQPPDGGSPVTRTPTGSNGTKPLDAKAASSPAAPREEAKPASETPQPAREAAKPVTETASAEARPANVEAKPASAETKPASVEARPANVEAKTASVEAKPASERRDEAPAPPPVEASTVPAPRRPIKPIDPTEAHVLVVEDNVPNFVLIARLLAYMGVPRCEWKTSGWQVVEFADTLPRIDLILMDIRLPYEDGFQALEKVRASERFKDTLVVAVTAEASVEQMKRAQECGFDGFLGKPLDPDRFPDQIRRVLKGEPVWEIH